MIEMVDRDEMISEEEHAVDVIVEAHQVYWEEIKKYKSAMKRLSIHDIRSIFDIAVKPAIQRVRELDREFKAGENQND